MNESIAPLLREARAHTVQRHHGPLSAQPLPQRWRRLKRWARHAYHERFDGQRLRWMLQMERSGYG